MKRKRKNQDSLYTENQGSCLLCDNVIQLPDLFFFCVECKAPICLRCFISEHTIPSEFHKQDHSYRVSTCLATKSRLESTESQLSLEEEILTLEAIEATGYGNWESCKKFLSTQRKAEEIKRYYNKEILEKLELIPMPEEEEKENNDQQVELEESLVEGYNPRRVDFETEYLNKTENSLLDLKFDDYFDKVEEHPSFQKLMTVVQTYQNVLKKRKDYKSIVDSLLIPEAQRERKQRKAKDRISQSINNDEKIFRKMIRPLAGSGYTRLSDFNKYNKLVEDLLEEGRVKKEIELLEKLRKQKMKSLEQIKDLYNSHFPDRVQDVVNLWPVKGQKRKVKIEKEELCEEEKKCIESLDISRESYQKVKKEIGRILIQKGIVEEKDGKYFVKEKKTKKACEVVVDVNKWGSSFDFFIRLVSQKK
eukprot:maker-scaffold_3-snap-gene-11.4-mRNA-1 protein AED:0.12 eAED:0.12 QI:89/1/1/1/1/1/2/113/419